MKDNTERALFALVRAGLWGSEVCLSPFDNPDFDRILILSQEQAVEGLVTAGLDHVKDATVPKGIILQFIGQSLQIEQRNAAMNQFIEKLVTEMRTNGIYTLLVKGQGIAQCYEKPQWRSSGDVDFFLSNDNFDKAKSFLLPLSSGNKPERGYSKELGMSIGSWYVEIHGSLRTGLSSRVDKVIDEVQGNVFYDGKVRSWMNRKTQVFLPAPDEDVFFVFTHYVKHFYKEGGVSLRQICDWCRLLWTYKDSLNHGLLEIRLNKAGLMSEWRGFAAVGVDYFGMPIDAMPLYSKEKKWSRKAEKIITFILKGGEWRRFQDTLLVGKIFPVSTLRFAPGILLNVNWLKVKERLFKS